MTHTKRCLTIPNLLMIIMTFVLMVVTGCDESDSNSITSFSFLASSNDQLNQDVAGIITDTTIRVAMPYGTDVQRLIATFSTTGESVAVNETLQTSGVTENDFTSSVAYTVTAEDKSVNVYTVTVSVAQEPSSDNDITAFSINGTNATINGTDIEITMPSGTDPQALVATFTTTGDSVSVNGTQQDSGVTANDFTNPVTYVVTAQDNTEKNYTATVLISEEPSSDKDITAFSIDGANATISGTDIDITLASGTDPQSLVATFTTSGESVTVNGTVQESGVTENDFSNPVLYVVTAQDDSEKNYTVTVSVSQDPSSDKDITAFSINGIIATINGTTITITMPSGTDPQALVASFTTTGESVAVNGTQQESGVTSNDFRNPVTYRVTAQDTTYIDYTVTVTISSTPSLSRVADHTIMNMVRLDQVPVAAIETAKSSLKIAYGHTSHGSQITTGMAELDEFKGDTGLYTFNSGGTDGAMEFHDYYRNFGGSSTTTTAHDLGNPNRTAWEQATREYLDSNTDINVIIWSWCGQAATSISNIDTYINLMEGLISDYPGVQFVFMTGHLNGSGLTGSLHIANEHIRNHCRTNNRWLFDFEDIESYDPDGNYFGDKLANDVCEYDSDGNQSRDANWAEEWQAANPGEWYSCGSAHSRPLNANQKAYSAWWLWARLAGWDGTP